MTSPNPNPNLNLNPNPNSPSNPALSTAPRTRMPISIHAPIAAPHLHPSPSSPNLHLSPSSHLSHSSPPFAPSPLQPFSPSLLEGFSRLLHFLLKAENDFICGVPSCVRDPSKRVNYRAGYHDRKLVTPIGTFPVRVPHVVTWRQRVSIVKRAKSAAPQVLEILAKILGIPGGTTSVSSAPLTASSAPLTASSPASSASSSDATVLIQLLWTMDFPGDLLSALTAQLVPILEQWRAQTLHCEAQQSVSPSPQQPIPSSAAPFSYAVY